MQIISNYSEIIRTSTDCKETDLPEESEAQFKSLVANIPGAVYRCACDSAWTMTYLSDGIQEISGYLASDFIHNRVRSFGSIIHPQDRGKVEESVWQSISTKQSYVTEYRIVREDGKITWVYDKGQAIFDREGEILWLDGVILDITQQKETEAELRRTQAFLNSVVQNLPVGVFIKDAQKLRIKYWNKASEELFGYTQDEVLGKNDYDFIPEDRADKLRAKDRQVLQGGKLVDIPESPIITPHRGERIVHTKKVPLLDDSGIPQHLLIICEDITARKRWEEALRESESHYRRIVETASEGVWLFDVHSKTTFLNSRMAQMLGYKVEEILGRSLFEFMDEESHALAQSYVNRRHQGIQERYDFKFRRQDGSSLWAIVSATPIFDTRGQFVGVLRMITDISERKRTEGALLESKCKLKAKNTRLKQTLNKLQQTQTQLIQNEKMASLGQMIAGIAHEINNPICFIDGNIVYANQYTSDLLHLLELYEKHYPEPVAEIKNEIETIDLDFLTTDFPKLLKSMKEGSNRIRKIVLSLRNFSRLDEAEIKQVHIDEGIDSTLLILQHRLKKGLQDQEIQVETNYGELPLIECYAGALNQVFFHIINNAIDALESQPQPRRITICTEMETREEDREKTGVTTLTQSVIIRIADNGSGIPETILQRIFDPFFTTKPIGAGKGLGLSISHSIIIDKHCGKLTCNSTVGKGTEFAIALPISQKVKSKIIG
ncbi:PAS domain S-box protein [Limnofasciculus baicalensis]|uniref:histidine kinase n=1 Tax=Limnofasciculus baicalensis BBK-W-15 TaxID=2699891 RepID=A0AAE3GXC5_9CYAN|nr:PAS domain S-box protein [Limnofasciculus baicalensis]MCP2731603.1 PAS domain S-box protein [Limnofasciculus baicalensis BBK-W-15]